MWKICAGGAADRTSTRPPRSTRLGAAKIADENNSPIAAILARIAANHRCYQSRKSVGVKARHDLCRSQIESSGSQPSRKFRFSGFGHRPSWYVRTAALGSRLGRLPKAEATGLAPKQSADALL